MSAAGRLDPPFDAAQLGRYRGWIERQLPAFRATKAAAERVRLLEEYAELLPLCVLARCPFCNAAVAEPFDALSLNGPGWSGPSAGFGWLPGRSTLAPLAPACTHLRIAAWFLNLEGRTPDDLFPDKVVRTGPEVPSIMRVPMRAEDAIAVIQPLPVGRWDDNAPAHRYTTWFVSYFTATRESFDAATRDWGVHWGRVEYGDVDYDLDRWARDGRLRWGAGDAAALAPAGAPFPYAGIEGDRSPERILRASGVEHPSDGLIGRVSRWFRSRPDS